MNIDKLNFIINNQLYKGFYLINKFHRILSDYKLNNDVDYKINSALLCLSEGYLCFNSAYILYSSNFGDGDNSKLEEVFNKFNDLNYEFINSYSINRSLKDVDAKYQEFFKAFTNYSEYIE